MKVSQTYIPGKSVRLLLQSFEHDLRHNKEHPPAESEDDTEGPLHLGVANGWRRNQAYKNLIVDAELDKLQNQEILEYFSGMVNNKKNTSQGSLGSDFKYWRIIENIDDSIKAAVIWLTGKGWKIRTISRTLEISELECRTLINENKYRQNLEKTIKNKSKLPFCIQTSHISVARKYVEVNIWRKITIAGLKSYLDDECPGKQLSKTGVHYLMKQVLGYSYKRAHKIPK